TAACSRPPRWASSSSSARTTRRNPPPLSATPRRTSARPKGRAADDPEPHPVPGPMILKFPDLDTLRLALTSGAVPPAVGGGAASAGFDAAGAVWVETDAPLPRAAQADLR